MIYLFFLVKAQFFFKNLEKQLVLHDLAALQDIPSSEKLDMIWQEAACKAWEVRHTWAREQARNFWRKLCRLPPKS